jgi:hypothetical protein
MAGTDLPNFLERYSSANKDCLGQIELDDGHNKAHIFQPVQAIFRLR